MAIALLAQKEKPAGSWACASGRGTYQLWREAVP